MLGSAASVTADMAMICKETMPAAKARLASNGMPVLWWRASRKAASTQKDTPNTIECHGSSKLHSERIEKMRADQTGTDERAAKKGTPLVSPEGNRPSRDRKRNRACESRERIVYVKADRSSRLERQHGCEVRGPNAKSCHSTRG
jgi:hypothetical protein